ncbi:MAG: MarR family transcriptional regulator [Bacteroidetes bacterium]|nr:MarR family transcriptional regulator [Bacteroidota bacterium]
MRTIVDLYPQYKDQSYGDRILVSIYYLRVMIERHLETRLAPFGITATQFRTLYVIREAKEEGIAVYNLRQFVSEPSSSDVSRLVARMEKAGWVKRGKNKIDKRQVLIFATKSGEELIAQLTSDRKTLELDMPELNEEVGEELYQHLQILVDSFTKAPK